MQHHTERTILGPMLTTAMLTAVLAGCSQNNTTDTSQVPPVTNPSVNVSSSETAVVGKKYADGTFSATGDYRSPGGPESVNVSLTLKDGVISDATFQGNAQGGISQRMQSNFAAGFKEQVVGKSIDSLALTTVNGSSLTPQGFMDAVQKIQAEAQAS